MQENVQNKQKNCCSECVAIKFVGPFFGQTVWALLNLALVKSMS